MQMSLLGLLLMTDGTFTISAINERGDTFVNFAEMPQHASWVRSHRLGAAVQIWCRLTPEDLPRYAALEVNGPDHLRPLDMTYYFLKRAAIEYLEGCTKLQAYLTNGWIDQSDTRVLEVLHVLKKEYREGR